MREEDHSTPQVIKLSHFQYRAFKFLLSNRVPTRTGKTGKPGKMGRHFPVREKSGNFEQTGKVREKHTKYWKTEGVSEKIICYFSMIFK